MDLTQDYFALFGLQAGYELDRAELERRFRELQRTVHPDRYASASDQERRIAMQRAAQINEAYRVLRDPLARARYLLELAGGAEDDESATHQDPAFLMEQMELREALESVRGAADPFGELNALMDRIRQALDGLEGELGRLFQAEPRDTAALRDAVRRMQFFRKLEQEAEEIEADLDDY
ncbi:MAG TPA: Fe-S protein assembly co-chaperone HscB [Thiotrichales bacterium]|nr:Fe-S protein assembly co-chaperone HscB [Thiotrichales bacterium]